MSEAAAVPVAVPAAPSRSLHIALWVVQVLLALAFGAIGAMKLFTPLEELAKNMPLATQAPGLLRFIGASEFAGALGLILPAATRIKPGLSALAGLGLLVVMVLAVGYHVMEHDLAHVGAPVVFGALAAFVAWGRFKTAPIAPR